MQAQASSFFPRIASASEPEPACVSPEPEPASASEGRARARDMGHDSEVDGVLVAVEGLYRTFARYPLRACIEGCPHCRLEDAEARLHTAPLRALSPDDLAAFASKAMTTFGDVDDFRHFLPRLAELATFRTGWELPQLCRKLVYAHWESWAEPERAAIEAWLQALERVVATDGSDIAIDPRDVVDASAVLGRNLEPLIARWIASPSPAAIDMLAEIVVDVAASANHSSPHPMQDFFRAQKLGLEHGLYGALERSDADVALIERAIDALAFPPFTGA